MRMSTDDKPKRVPATFPPDIFEKLICADGLTIRPSDRCSRTSRCATLRTKAIGPQKAAWTHLVIFDGSEGRK
ncbi:MAG: hypothetical protein QOH88_1760 [Verrucomicrobiota bacterium]